MRTYHGSSGLTLKNSLTINGALMDATLPVVTRRTCVCPGQRSDSAMNLRGMDVRCGCACSHALILAHVTSTRPYYRLAAGELFKRRLRAQSFRASSVTFSRIFSLTHSMTHPVNETKFPGAQGSRHQSCRRLNACFVRLRFSCLIRHNVESRSAPNIGVIVHAWLRYEIPMITVFQYTVI